VNTSPEIGTYAFRTTKIPIRSFRKSGSWNEYNAPLRRTVSIEEVGETCAYLVSDWSRGVTGEIMHVDAGYHIVGMKNPDAPDMSLDKAD
jgi:enoyl-[acyl-carrier protein] reductase I